MDDVLLVIELSLRMVPGAATGEREEYKLMFI